MLHGSSTNMSLANATSGGDACEPLSQFPRPSEAHLQLPATNTINDLPISDKRKQAEAVAQMPNLVTSPSFSLSQGKEQSGSQATTSSQFLSLQKVASLSPTAKVKVDGTRPTQVISQAALDTDGSKLAQMAQAAPSTSVVAVEIGGRITSCEAIVSSDRAPSSNENVEATPASSITYKSREMTGMTNEEALAFLNCHSLMTDKRILTEFSNKTWDYPATVNFARQAVKIIAKERESKALLNWLDTGIFEDPEHSGDKAEHLPVINHPFWWRIEDGEYGYPPDSIGQESGNNTYLCSKPMSVTVGPSGVTYYVHKNVLALSPVLERMCETVKAKETACITMPDDDPSVFEHLLGYLYFQKFNLPVQEIGWFTDLEQPCQTQPHVHLANDIIMKTYILAAKYGVNRLKPVLLKSLEIGTIEELYSSAKTVYDANADDGDFRDFFKKELMVKLEKALDDGLYDPDVSLRAPNTLSDWGSLGGRLGADVIWALANKVRAKHELDRDDEINQKCEACGETECQCEMGTGEDNEAPASYHDNQFGCREWGDKINPSTNNKNNNASCEELQQDSNANNLSKEFRELTDKMSYLVAQLGNNQGLGSAEGLRQTKAGPLWQATAAPKHFGEQIGGGSIIQGPPNEQGPNSWCTPMPALLSRQLHPLMQNRSTSESRTAVAIQASNPWDCSITFPTGAIITNVRPTLDRDGESYLVGCCGGLYGSFPARHVQML